MDTSIKDFFKEICIENDIPEYESTPALKM